MQGDLPRHALTASNHDASQVVLTAKLALIKGAVTCAGAYL